MAEREHQELSFRYKERCAENARVRAIKHANTMITTQVLKNVRALLRQEYSAPEKQQDYLERVTAHLRKGAHDRA
jgi:predicted nucleic acid-binding protein